MHGGHIGNGDRVMIVPNAEVDEHRHRWRYAGRCQLQHSQCELPFWLVCLDCYERKVARCGRTARSMCQPCGETYRRRVKRVFASGWCDNPYKAMVMLTVTAPGGDAHALANGQRCPCTPEGGICVGEFNSVAGQCFNRLMQELRRRYGDIQYARAAEIQKRGALHFHIVMRVPRLAVLLGDFTKRSPYCALRVLIEHHGFGHEIELEPAKESAAWYCAKYVSKSCDDRQTIPWLDISTGELTQGNGRYRPWTASRRWGATMTSIRATQAEWVRSAEAPDGKPPQAAPADAAAFKPNTHRYTTEPALGDREAVAMD
jgi:hypothetical protein